MTPIDHSRRSSPHAQQGVGVRELAKVLWDYHNVEYELPEKADFLLVTGSHDDRVAEHAADLMRHGIAPLAVTSGGYGKVTKDLRTEPEAERFKRIIVDAGVSADAVLVEPDATNTGDNIVRTRDLLDSYDMEVITAIIVTKPYMKRRALATAMKQWPEVRWWVSAPEITFDKYPNRDVPERQMIELMVGDLQRLEVYAGREFQVPQEIPTDVWDAYDALVALGYDQYVIQP
ncbi:MAG TPA: YdcF family protein [Propionibacteriaceae bacterium]